MSGKHTPGPWSVFPHWCKNDPDPGPYGETLLIGKGQYDTLAEVRPGSDDYGTEYEANARLIAAAPELVGLIKAYLDWGNASPREFQERQPQFHEDGVKEIDKAARVLLARIEGSLPEVRFGGEGR